MGVQYQVGELWTVSDNVFKSIFFLLINMRDFSDSNTWEPINNLSHCKKLLELFEEQLKRMKEEKAKQAAQSPKFRGRPCNPKPVKPSASNFVPIAPKNIATISNVIGGVGDSYVGMSR